MSNPSAVQLQFRAWDNEKKRFFRKDGYDESMVCVSTRGQIYLFDDEPYGSNTDRFILMQFTGYKDKYGNKVFANDIVLFHDPDIDDPDNLNQYWLVEQELGGFWVDKSGLWDYSKDLSSKEWGYQLENLEVVGNLYEDAELLSDHKIKGLKEKGIL